jgi:hypothetical protein
MAGMTEQQSGEDPGGVVTDGGEGAPAEQPEQTVSEVEFVPRNWFEDDDSLQSFEFTRTAATSLGQLQQEVEEFLGHTVEMSSHGVEPGQDPSEEQPLTVYVALDKAVEVDEAGLRRVVDEHVPVPPQERVPTDAPTDTPTVPDTPDAPEPPPPDTDTQAALDKLDAGTTLTTAELTRVLRYSLDR